MILFFSLAIGLNVQARSISGIVKNDMGEFLSEVTIIVNGKEESSISDCKGKFKIQAEKGDSLIFSKEGYKIRNIKIKRHTRHRITLTFDYAKFRDNLEKDTSFNKSFYPDTGQPLFIIDGRHAGGEYYWPVEKEVSKDDILSSKIIKGEKRLLFGRFAVNGVVWIRTKCGYSPKTEIE